MDRLPNELRGAILQRCSLSSLKNIRLVSRVWGTLGSEYLIQPVFRSVPHENDISRLQGIASHPLFSNQITGMSFNHGEVNEYHARHNTYFLQYMRDPEDRLESQVSAWEIYAGLKEKKELHLPNSCDLEQLTAIFGRLPKLETIEVTLMTCPFTEDEHPEVLKDIWKIPSTRLLPRVATTERFTNILLAAATYSGPEDDKQISEEHSDGEERGEDLLDDDNIDQDRFDVPNEGTWGQDLDEEDAINPDLSDRHQTLPRRMSLDRQRAGVHVVNPSDTIQSKVDGANLRIQHLIHDRLPLEFFAQKLSIIGNLRPAFRNLSDLTLGIDYSDMPNNTHYPEAFLNLSRFLRAATGLKRLDLSFQGRRKVDVDMLIEMLDHGQHDENMGSLESLKLGGVIASEHGLGGFLREMNKKALGKVQIGGLGVRNKHQAPKGGVHLSSGSFAGLMGMLDEEAAGLEVSFLGDLEGQESGERWVMDRVVAWVEMRRKYVTD